MGTILRRTPQYTAFSGMFDEFRINGIRIKLTPNFQVASPATFDSQGRPQIVYAWDRNGVTSELTNPIMTFENIASYGSAVTRSMAPGTANHLVTNIYATDLIERAVYMATQQRQQNGNEPIGPYGFLPDFLLGVKLPVAAAAATTFAWDAEVWFDLTFRGVRFTGATP